MMKILVDNGVVSSSNFLVADSREQQLRWGKTVTRWSIAGFKRAELDRDADQQSAKDALFTIGRLVREGRIALYTYSELTVESWRGGRGREHFVNALGQCTSQHCRAPIERSKFRQTLNMKEWFAKGGKTDREKGRSFSHFNQIPYLHWLSLLSPLEIEALLDHASIIGLDDFEITSLHDLPWFQGLSRALGSPENLPDCFHIWTARRNGLDAFLTMEKKLPRSFEQFARRRSKAMDVSVAVLRPTDLLHSLGVSEIDAVPIEPGRFYTYMEIFEIDGKLIHGQDRR